MVCVDERFETLLNVSQALRQPVPLRFPPFIQDGGRSCDRHTPTVWTIAGHRIIAVRNRDHPRSKGNGMTGKLVGDTPCHPSVHGDDARSQRPGGNLGTAQSNQSHSPAV